MGQKHGEQAVLLMIGLTLVAGCGGNQQPGSQPAQQPAPEVTVAQPAVRMISDRLEFPGRTAAVQRVEIRSRVGGYLLRTPFVEGAEVKAGDLLFQIDPEPYITALHQAEGNLESAQARLVTQNRDVIRYQALQKKGSVSQQQLDTATGARDETQSTQNSLQAAVERARLDLQYTRITAPISGQVSRMVITPGNLVIANQTVLTSIVTVDPIYAYFDADEASVLRVRKLIEEHKFTSYRQARLPAYLRLSDEPGFPHAGVINFVENALDPGTGTLSVRGVFPNPHRLLSPGMFVRMMVPVGKPYRTLAVPAEALNTDQRGDFLKVVRPDDKVEERMVTTGRTENGMVAIRKGIGPTDRVVVRGLQRARAGSRVRPTEERLPAVESARPVASQGASIQ